VVQDSVHCKGLVDVGCKQTHRRVKFFSYENVYANFISYFLHAAHTNLFLGSILFTVQHIKQLCIASIYLLLRCCRL